jgi:hypothetical protein
MKLLPFLLLFALLPAPLFAADEKPAAATEAPKQDSADLDKRIELSKKWHGLMPVSVRDQVNLAIEEAAAAQPENQKEIFRANMRNILNYQAIEKISIDAMAEIYTAAELEALIDYYSKPEAKSASSKYQQYAGKVYPEITRMLDQAMMRARTGGTGAQSTPVPPAAGQ